jgi:hypothetical protein
MFYVIWITYKHKFHFLVLSFGMNIVFCIRLINEKNSFMYIQFGKFWSIPQNDANLGQWATTNTKFYMFSFPFYSNFQAPNIHGFFFKTLHT